MPSARLRLEILLRQPVADLDAICDVIRSDIGLSAGILRLANGGNNPLPTQIQDVVVSLGTEFLHFWVNRLCLANSRQRPALSRLEIHARFVARTAEVIARTSGGVEPQKAYFGGLLHVIGELPSLLEETDLTRYGADTVRLGLMLASAWRLPRYISEAIQYQQSAAENILLGRVVGAAHEWATGVERELYMDRNEQRLLTLGQSIGERWLTFLPSRECRLMFCHLGRQIDTWLNRDGVSGTGAEAGAQTVRISN